MLRVLPAGLWLILSIPAAEAARVVPAPSQALVHPRNRVALVEILELQEPAKVRCRVLESLVGDSPELLEVRLRPETLEEAQPGERYLLGYTTLRKNPLLRDVIEEDPDGPKAVRLPLAEDALLRDRPEIRLLISVGLDRDAVPLSRQLGAVMTLIDGTEPRARQLATFELFARGELVEKLGANELERLAAHIRSVERSPSERDILLRTLYKLPPERRRGPAASACRVVLGQLDPQFDLSTAEPTLAVTAANLLGETGKGDDLSLLMPFVSSNNPAVGRAAFDAMRQLDSDASRRHARAMLDKASLHDDVRRYLESQL